MPTAISATVKSGIPAIGLWRDRVAEHGLHRTRDAVRGAGLRVSSLCRGGYFTSPEGPTRRAELDDNRRAVDEAATLNAPVLVLVAGGLPDGDRDLVGARSRVADALAELTPYAASSGVRLSVEPLHPMYASDRSVVSTLAQAIDLSAPHPAGAIGVTIDTYHLWWNPELAVQLARAGAAGRIAMYQIADWVTPITANTLLARGMPGDGRVNFSSITRLVVEAGYTDDVECEVFRQNVWDTDPFEVAKQVATMHSSLIAPLLGNARQ